MKKIITAMSALVSLCTLASEGKIEVTKATNMENTLELIISGDAADTISKQLTDNGTSFTRDSFSGARVQLGNGIRCIDQHGDRPLYCYIAVIGSSVN